MIKKLLAFGVILSLTSPFALALKDDTAQKLYIDSLDQQLDMQNNTVTFTGDVKIRQGSISIDADKVIIVRDGDKEGSEVIEAFGNPIHFSQKQENGKLVKGQSKKLHYELKAEKLILTGAAVLEQQNSSVKAEQITYLVKAQKMEATTSSGKRVITVLEPSELRDK